jgi:hypothetical protein
MTQDKSKRLGRATPQEVLLFNFLVHRLGMNPAQAAVIAWLAWGGDE